MSGIILRIQKAAVLFLFMALACPVLAEEKVSETDLRRLERWTQRDKASLIKLDELGEQLLNKYEKPEQRGEIYYNLAHQHAQGGFVFPQKFIEYSKAALSFPLTPDQKMRLHVYWGDVLQIVDRKKSFAERRKESVVLYLRGLKELKEYQLPDTPPALPNQPLLLVSGPGASQEVLRKQEEEQRKYEKARERVEFVRNMTMHRRVLEGQIVALYGRGPIATEELKATATNILGEGKELDRLMADVNERVSKLPPDTERIMTPIEADAPAMPSKYLYLGIGVGIGAVIAAVLFLLARRSRAKRVAGSKPLQ